ncbi:hypothetical protein [Streptomyces sp. CG 926]|uniref:hypothetical protein n=1 Tax=Streptomyces sp. CG 926 TaxID=1882405 RepID=UPI0011B41BD7|nr:hypothetical protein [Streptomyces sp. CG 926]
MGNWGGTAVAHATVAELREFAAEAGYAGVDGDEDLGGGWSAVPRPAGRRGDGGGAAGAADRGAGAHGGLPGQ